MRFTVSGLPIEKFRPLFGLDDAALAERGVLRRKVGAGDRAPCRITLEDAAVGETVLLLNYEHQPAASPYRSNYAIYVSEAATETRRLTDALPGVFRGRSLALRAFDAQGLLVGAELTENDGVRAAIERQFANPEAAYLHVHNAVPGCYSARIDRG
jgi:Protein of unknown function (DUF1203)